MNPSPRLILRAPGASIIAALIAALAVAACSGAASRANRRHGDRHACGGRDRDREHPTLGRGVRRCVAVGRAPDHRDAECARQRRDS